VYLERMKTMETKVYGRDKRLDFAEVKIDKDKVIADKYLLHGILESIYIVMNEKSKNK
jgi:hypothetical protein